MKEISSTQSNALNPLALIIEDDDKLSTIYAEALRQTHFTTAIVSDGAIALAQVTALRPVLIILDLHLPHVSGKSILQHIRQDESLANIHVIVTTADAVQAAAVQDEADLVLIKPVSFLQLRDLARRIRSTLA
ncbi:MAG TPA: response regulator [Anaerolineae bacterium]|nr:response regulator [Anaerolineae bacterium]